MKLSQKQTQMLSRHLTPSFRKTVHVPSKKPKSGTVSHFFSDLTGAKAARKHASGYDRVKSEIDRYIQEPLLDLDDNSLEWWKSRQSQYPLISQLVKKYWSLPATSLRSEEAFSTAGNVLTKKQNRLLPENVDNWYFYMIMCKICTCFV